MSFNSLISPGTTLWDASNIQPLYVPVGVTAPLEVTHLPTDVRGL